MKVLSTEGLTKLIQLIKSTFIPASDTVSATAVTLADVATSGDIGDLTNVTLTTPSSGQVLSYDGSKWVNSSTGAGVTDVEVNGTSVVVGGVASVTVPTQASDVNALPNSTKYGADLDLTSGTLQLLDQDGNALGNSVTVPDTANFVQKTGDTMTGALTVAAGDRKFYLPQSGTTKGTAPSGTVNNQIVFNDSVNSTDTATSRLGIIEQTLDSSGNSSISIGAVRNTVSSTDVSRFKAKITNTGVASCEFPNTTCVDSDFHTLGITIASNVSVNGTTATTYTLSDIPNDGYKHMALIAATATSGSTSGNNCIVQVITSLMNASVNIARAQTRTSSAVGGAGAVWIPIPSDRKITLNKSSDWNGTATLYLRGYRRIGTND